MKNYENKYYLFEDKKKLIIKDGSKLIDIDNLSNSEMVIIKSILKNININKNEIKKDISQKIISLKNKIEDKNNKFKEVNVNDLLEKIDELDYSDEFKNKKDKIISNIFDYNQSGGGLLYILGLYLDGNKYHKLSETMRNFLKILFLSYNSLLGLIDILLDVSLIDNNLGIKKYDFYSINLTHLAYAILNLDSAGIFTVLLAVIPEFGELLSGSAGLTLNFYRFMSYIRDTFYDDDEEIQDTDSEDEFDKELVTLKDKYIPKPGESYNQSFYERIKLL